MVATLALARHARPRTNRGTFLLVLPLVATVIVGLLLMHVLVMYSAEEGTAHDGAGAAVTISERATANSTESVAEHGGVHAGDTCVGPSPPAFALFVPTDSPDLGPGVAQPPATRPGPTGDGPDLFSLCVQRR